MSEMIAWIAAEAERPEVGPGGFPFGRKRRFELDRPQDGPCVEKLPAHRFPAQSPEQPSSENPNPSTGSGHGSSQSPQGMGHPAPVDEKNTWEEQRAALEELRNCDQQRRIYRGRTCAMLRRYMRYSLETGRLPSLVGREFFRSKVTKYRVTTFEDRVIFVHDMETCLERLDEFSRRVLGRVVLQEYEHEEAARLLGCTRMTVHRKLLEALDTLSDILVEVDLLDALPGNREKSCQEGEEAHFFISDCEQGK